MSCDTIEDKYTSRISQAAYEPVTVTLIQWEHASGLWFCHLRSDIPDGQVEPESNRRWFFEGIATPICVTKKEAVSLIEKLITDVGFKNVKRNYKRSRYV